MTDIEQLVEKFRTKLLTAQKAEKYRNEVITPLVNKIFNEDFARVFENLANEINARLNSKVVSFNMESKARFVIQGKYHRIYFQKGKVDLINEIINVNIIPIYIWKGVTRHLGPVSISVNPACGEIKWDMPHNNVEEYSKDLFGKLVDDEDFSM